MYCFSGGFAETFAYHFENIKDLFAFGYVPAGNNVYLAFSRFLYTLIFCWVLFLIVGILVNKKKDRKIMWVGIILTFLNILIFLFLTSGLQRFWEIIDAEDNRDLLFSTILMFLFGTFNFMLSIGFYFFSLATVFVQAKEKEEASKYFDKELRDIVKEEIAKEQSSKELDKKPIVEPILEAEDVDEYDDDRIQEPFMNRILKANLDVKANYNEIKNDILSYGLESIVSKSGEVFVLHNKKYIRIFLVDKALKVYLALNPKDYKDSMIPVEDVSDKSACKETPLLFRVEADLSVIYCKELIKDLMDKDSLIKKESNGVDWVNEIRLQNAEKEKDTDISA